MTFGLVSGEHLDFFHKRFPARSRWMVHRSFDSCGEQTLSSAI